MSPASSSHQEVPSRGAEVALELTYLAQIASWLAAQPDMQYVINPGPDRTIRNAFAGALRFELFR
ncbi:MAG: carbohydrate porin [Gemmatimonadaceae bacterium]